MKAETREADAKFELETKKDAKMAEKMLTEAASKNPNRNDMLLKNFERKWDIDEHNGLLATPVLPTEDVNVVVYGSHRDLQEHKVLLVVSRILCINRYIL